MIRRLLVILGLTAVSAFAQSAPAQAPKVQKHALVKIAAVVSAPVVKPVSTLKKTFGTVVFAVESGVDVVHGGADLADKAFDAISVQGKIPVLDMIYSVVSVVDKDSGKLDSWLEKQEVYLFGTSN